MISYRILKESDFPHYHQTLLKAFSDYYVDIHPAADALRRMLVIEGGDFDYSVGAFDGEKMVGFTINAIDDWLGILTAYDAGTGVIPEYRRRGISREMFKFILPFLRRQNVKQYLLEVITENEPAIELYKNFGFKTRRDLGVFSTPKLFSTDNARQDVAVEEIENPDWSSLESFWEFYPSWQNSCDSIKRCVRDATILKSILGLYFNQKLVGYGIVLKNSGNVAQLAIAKEHRRKGLGTTLLNALQKQTEKPLLFSNIDESADGFAAFLKSNGFEVLTRQYEMLLKL